MAGATRSFARRANSPQPWRAAKSTAEAITAESFAGCLDTQGIPDPELVIRTSGELRLSNFLLWQAAYSELVFLPCYWPDFSREHLAEALREFAGRERRFGGIEPARRRFATGRGMSNLQLRVISAVVLAIITLGLTWLGGLPFRLLCAAMSAVIFYEWTRMSRPADGHGPGFPAARHCSSFSLAP